MKILITGGLGFIGSHFVRKALTNDHHITIVDVQNYAAMTAPEELKNLSDNFHFVSANIQDRDAMRKAIFDCMPDAIVHMAAESHVDRSISNPSNFVLTNLLGTSVLLEEATSYWTEIEQRQDFRFLHISTDEVFGALGPNGQFDENSNYRPNSPYSASKAGSDMLVRAFQTTYGLPTITTNCSNNFGPNQHSEKLIPTILRSIFSGNQIPIYGKGKNIRDWLYVEDHVDALFTVLEKAESGTQYLIGGGQELTNLDLAERLLNLARRNYPASKAKEANIEFVQDRPGHDFRYSIDASKIKTELGWSPQHTFDQALVTTLNWYAQKYLPSDE